MPYLKTKEFVAFFLTSLYYMHLERWCILCKATSCKYSGRDLDNVRVALVCLKLKCNRQ